jgi:aminoglycoside phosphotransferase (APT) family kinase protein
LPVLLAGLRDVWDSAGSNPVAILEREPNIYGSTFPSEVILCGLADGSRRRLFCKYDTGASNADFGHRGGIIYEAEVYQRVLRSSGISVPGFIGTYTDPKTGRAWLILDYLEDNAPLGEAPDVAPERLAARWIGLFHAAHEARIATDPMPFLNRYDAAYYGGWACRLGPIVGGPRHRRYPWVARLCERFNEVMAPLLASAPTIIHGEFYPPNILVQDGVIYPVDWESAAIGAGEIDLASLTEGWPKGAARKCEQDYKEARWPQGAPPDFEQRLVASRMYLACRWLADARESRGMDPDPWYLKQLQSAGRRLGIIQP